jgi:putative tryptophan/tyrosine transport system substrate-binding protein
VRRRQVIAGVAALVVVPRQSAAQRAAARIPRVGVLTPADSADTAIFDAFRAGLRDLGYVEGHNLILEFRLAHGDAAVLPKLAADLASVPVDVILADGEAVRVAMAATKQIPIVMGGGPGGDPVALGIAASLARPGGNVTGTYPMQAALSAKRLEILQLAFPQISTVAVLLRPSNSTADDLFREVVRAGQSLALTKVARIEADTPEALGALPSTAFADFSAVMVLPDAMFWNHRREILALVDAARLPAIYPEREYVEDGGLMAYGANIPYNFRRAAGYVDRILKGAAPGDLPIEQSTKFDFIVNLKAARKLGLTVPPAILDRADEVIE